MRTDQLALSRSATDRDAERRSEPGLLERLAADPETRLLLVDARGRVALTGPAIHPDLPDDGLTPPSLIGSPGATAWEGPGTRSGWGLPDLRVGYLGASTPTRCPDLTVLYMGRELADHATSTGPAWIAVVVPQALEVPDAPEPPATGSDAAGTAPDHTDQLAVALVDGRVAAHEQRQRRLSRLREPTDISDRLSGRLDPRGSGQRVNRLPVLNHLEVDLAPGVLVQTGVVRGNHAQDVDLIDLT